MTKTAKRTRSVICTILAFLLSVGLTLGFTCTTLALSALSPDFAVRTAVRSDYSEHLSAELQEEFISYGNACNIDHYFFEDFFHSGITPEKIDRDTETVLREFYAGSVQDSVDTTALRADLLSALYAYATENGHATGDAAEQVAGNPMYDNLSLIADELCEIYNAYISVFSMSVFKTASRLLATYRPYAWYGAAAGAVLTAISAILIQLAYQKRKNYLRFYLYGCSGAALMLAVAPATALLLQIGNNISLASASLYDFATGMLNGVLTAVLLSALLPAALTVILAFLRQSAVRKNR